MAQALPHHLLSRNQYQNGRYTLRKYHWRSSMMFIGSLLALAFYAFICFAFLRRPPMNDIVLTTLFDAQWVYYAWFVVVIFMLDWSRAGLANIEAAALMYPQLAPATALQLMWHTDGNWANPLWWFRAFRAHTLVLIARFKARVQGRLYQPQDHMSPPGGMWSFLCFTTVVLYAALPLSGLTMEIKSVSIPSKNRTLIYGPNAWEFNNRTSLDLPQQIRQNWLSGRQTTPSSRTLLYAPAGTQPVSETYFRDQALAHAENVEFFMGPTVRELVSGRAWGVSANISCKPVYKNQMQLIHVDDFFRHAINRCDIPNGVVFRNGAPPCNFTWSYNMTPLSLNEGVYKLRLPLSLNETGILNHVSQFSYVAAADGWNQNMYAIQKSPYNYESSHDTKTYDHLVNRRPIEQTTSAIFEIFLWELNVFKDDTMTLLTSGRYPDPVEILSNPFYHDRPNGSAQLFAGIGVHCDVKTAVGSAVLNPSQRTFSSFTHTRANSTIIHDSHPQQHIMPPAQVLALTALSNPNAEFASDLVPNDGNETALSTSTWAALHAAIGSAPVAPVDIYSVLQVHSTYAALIPKDLQLAVYKLLGESVIAMMDEGGMLPWYGDLFALASTRYLVSGTIPWEYALTLLCIWAFIMSASALWIAFLAGPRWAHSLDGFEMFKLGARWPDHLDRLEAIEFQKCAGVLRDLPGMVGMMPGTGGTGVRLGFIGLSESVASKSLEYTLDRREAASTRPV